MVLIYGIIKIALKIKNNNYFEEKHFFFFFFAFGTEGVVDRYSRNATR